jgi:hypothetical protein
VIGNVFMEDCEEVALSRAACKTIFWFRYFDMFVNIIHPDIHFTMEAVMCALSLPGH